MPSHRGGALSRRRLSWRGLRLPRRLCLSRRLSLWQLGPARLRLATRRRHRGRRSDRLRQRGDRSRVGRTGARAGPVLVLYRPQPAAGVLGRLSVGIRVRSGSLRAVSGDGRSNQRPSRDRLAFDQCTKSGANSFKWFRGLRQDCRGCWPRRRLTKGPEVSLRPITRVGPASAVGLTRVPAADGRATRGARAADASCDLQRGGASTCALHPRCRRRHRPPRRRHRPRPGARA